MLADGLLEAVDAVHHRLHSRIVDDRDLALVAEFLGHQLTGLDAAGVVVGADVGGDVDAVGRHVDGDHLDAGLLGLLDHRLDALAVDRRQHDDVDALDDEVLDVGELLVEVLIGDRHFELDVLGGGLGLHGIGELDVERMLLGEQRGADAVGHGRRGEEGEGGAGESQASKRTNGHLVPPTWPPLRPILGVGRHVGRC